MFFNETAQSETCLTASGYCYYIDLMLCFEGFMNYDQKKINPMIFFAKTMKI